MITEMYKDFIQTLMITDRLSLIDFHELIDFHWYWL